MQGERNTAWWVFLTAMVSFFTMLYFGKSGFAVNVLGGDTELSHKISAYFTAPFNINTVWNLKGYAWYGSLNFLLGWFGSIVFLVSGTAAFVFMLREPSKYFGSAWSRIKYSYLIVCAVSFTWIYFSNILGRKAGWVEEPTYWYSLLYTTTIILFGIRRMQVKPTKYIIYQTLTLMGIQTFFLFLLPFYLYDSVVVNLFSTDMFKSQLRCP